MELMHVSLRELGYINKKCNRFSFLFGPLEAPIYDNSILFNMDRLRSLKEIQYCITHFGLRELSVVVNGFTSFIQLLVGVGEPL